MTYRLPSKTKLGPEQPRYRSFVQIAARVVDEGAGVFVAAKSCPLVTKGSEDTVIYCKTGQSACPCFRGVCKGHCKCTGKRAQMQQLRPGDQITVQGPQGEPEVHQVETVDPNGRLVLQKQGPAQAQGVVPLQPLTPSLPQRPGNTPTTGT